MALSAWDKTRIHGTWYTHTGARIPGTYTVTMPVRVTIAEGEAIVPAGVYATGDLVTGNESVPALDVMVPANDDPDVTPLGWQATVEVRLSVPGGAKITERYVIDTPVGGTVNLRTIPLAQTIPPTQTMLLRGVAGGVAALDSQGRVVDADGNPVTGAVDPAELEQSVADYLAANPVVGEPGADGADGADGKSAYQVARDHGYGGTETEWLASLKGDKGDKGDPGADGADGAKGDKGDPGEPGPAWQPTHYATEAEALAAVTAGDIAPGSIVSIEVGP